MTCRQGVLLAIRWLRKYEPQIDPVDRQAFTALLKGLDRIVARKSDTP